MSGTSVRLLCQIAVYQSLGEPSVSAVPTLGILSAGLGIAVPHFVVRSSFAAFASHPLTFMVLV